MIIICMDLWILDVFLPFLEMFGCNPLLNSNASIYECMVSFINPRRFLSLAKFTWFFLLHPNTKQIRCGLVDNDYEVEMLRLLVSTN